MSWPCHGAREQAETRCNEAHRLNDKSITWRGLHQAETVPYAFDSR